MSARSKGSGRLFVRGNRWYIRIRNNGIEETVTTGIKVSDDPDGVRARKFLDEETEVLRLKDKEKRLAIVKVMLEDTKERIRDRLAGVRRERTIGELAELFKGSARRIDCSGSQLDTYLRYIRALEASIGPELKIADLDDRLAEQFASVIAVGNSPNTYNKYLNGLTLIWRTVGPSVGTTANPWQYLPRKRLDTHSRRLLTQSEVESLLNKTDGEMRVFLAIGLFTGLRMGDAIHLDWGIIRNGAIYYANTRKTGADVAIPLHPRLAEVLGKPKKRGLVVPELADLYDTQGSSAVTRKVNRAFSLCGINVSYRKSDKSRARPDAGYHSLRHWFVTRCIECGVSSSIVRALVGHTTARMTEHYTHLQNADFLEAFKKIS